MGKIMRQKVVTVRIMIPVEVGVDTLEVIKQDVERGIDKVGYAASDIDVTENGTFEVGCWWDMTADEMIADYKKAKDSMLDTCINYTFIDYWEDFENEDGYMNPATIREVMRRLSEGK